MATSAAASGHPVVIETAFKHSGEGYLLLAVSMGGPVFTGRVGFAVLDCAAAERWAAARGIPDGPARMERGERLVWEGGPKECRSKA